MTQCLILILNYPCNKSQSNIELDSALTCKEVKKLLKVEIAEKGEIPYF